MIWIIAKYLMIIFGPTLAFVGWGIWRNSSHEDEDRRKGDVASLDAGEREARVTQVTFNIDETPEGRHEAFVCIEGGKIFGALRTDKGAWEPLREIGKPIFFHER